jgi:7,8-dihydropterin-6-yl-methyl-4-(beta-D-ribofuranosyl)aminobenzene 5'-phosphate synthase
VHAVVGGFHLVRPRTDDEARRTVAEFAKIDPTYIIPMHCTGEVFIAEALRVMPEKIDYAINGTIVHSIGKSDQDQLNAIVDSPWGTTSLIFETYPQVSVKK